LGSPVAQQHLGDPVLDRVLEAAAAASFIAA